MDYLRGLLTIPLIISPELVLKLENRAGNPNEITMVDINSLRNELKKFSEHFTPDEHQGTFLKEMGARIWNFALQMSHKLQQPTEINVHSICFIVY